MILHPRHYVRARAWVLCERVDACARVHSCACVSVRERHFYRTALFLCFLTLILLAAVLSLPFTFSLFFVCLFVCFCWRRCWCLLTPPGISATGLPFTVMQVFFFFPQWHIQVTLWLGKGPGGPFVMSQRALTHMLGQWPRPQPGVSGPFQTGGRSWKVLAEGCKQRVKKKKI